MYYISKEARSQNRFPKEGKKHRLHSFSLSTSSLFMYAVQYEETFNALFITLHPTDIINPFLNTPFFL